MTFLRVSFISLLMLLGCSSAEVPNKSKDSTTSAKEIRIDDSNAMQKKINAVISNCNLHESIYNNAERIAFYEKSMGNNVNAQGAFLLAREYLNKGDSERALKLIEKIKSSLDKNVNNESKHMLLKFKAICLLRMAEQQNCQNNHTDESCIVPIGQNGIHKLEKPAENALRIYSEILEIAPDDKESQWLLNLCYMVLDQYPEKVPSKYLINLPHKESNAFSNKATYLGIDEFDLSGGVVADDFNNDGLIDILCSSWSMKGKVKLYLNRGENGFEDVTKNAGISQIVGGLNLKQADFNNDGHLDFIILRGGWFPLSSWGILPNSLVINNGDGTFSDQTISLGFYSERPTQSATCFDYDNDGWVDIFIANETTEQSDHDFPCQLFKNNNGKFEEISDQVNLNAIGYFKGVNAADINNDGYSDLFLSNLDGPNYLFLNKAGKSFENISKSAGVEEPNAAFPCWFFDFNNDGFEDIYVASYDDLAFNDQAGQFARDLTNSAITTEKNILYINKGDNTFRKQVQNKKSLSTMGCNYGDIDNDGYKDFYLGTGSPDYRSVVPNRFFKNSQGKDLVEQTFELGLGHIQKGHGISFADFDNDGDLDIYAVMGGAFQGDKFPNAYFENTGNANDFIKLKLVGNNCNKSAIGSRIRLTTQSGRKIYHTVNSGASFGANALLAHIGTGNEYIESVEINWANGTNTWLKINGLEQGKQYLVNENETPVEKEFSSLVFKGSNSQGNHHHH
ncbi:MAG: VCBS repeat-containing protein [Bacteroidota bacterium]